MLGRVVGVRFELGSPILGQTEAFGDGSKAGEDGSGKIDGLAEFAKLAEGFVGLLRFAGSVEKVSGLGRGQGGLGGFVHQTACDFDGFLLLADG